MPCGRRCNAGRRPPVTQTPELLMRCHTALLPPKASWSQAWIRGFPPQMLEIPLVQLTSRPVAVFITA